jgi:hypothetical protein
VEGEYADACTKILREKDWYIRREVNLTSTLGFALDDEPRYFKNAQGYGCCDHRGECLFALSY